MKERIKNTEGREPWEPGKHRHHNKVPAESGLFHTDGEWDGVLFRKAPNETVLPKPYAQAQIVFGTDRPDSIGSGYGAPGSNIASSIDMVVGRMSSINDGDGPKDGSVVDSSFAADAARIYISQLTDIDKNFAIAPGASGVMEGRSGIGIKADGVRIIGREGVKIVTGRARGWKGFSGGSETNSLGGKLERAPKIELLAGNNAATKSVFGGLFNAPEKMTMLQGVAKGENTRKALQGLSKVIDEIWSATFLFMCYQMSFNAAIGPSLSPLPAAPIIGGIASTCLTGQVNSCLNPLYHTRTNKTVWEANYLSRMGYRFIESRNVFAT